MKIHDHPQFKLERVVKDVRRAQTPHIRMRFDFGSAPTDRIVVEFNASSPGEEQSRNVFDFARLQDKSLAIEHTLYGDRREDTENEARRLVCRAKAILLASSVIQMAQVQGWSRFHKLTLNESRMCHWIEEVYYEKVINAGGKVELPHG